MSCPVAAMIAAHTTASAGLEGAPNPVELTGFKGQHIETAGRPGALPELPQQEVRSRPLKPVLLAGIDTCGCAAETRAAPGPYLHEDPVRALAHDEINLATPTAHVACDGCQAVLDEEGFRTGLGVGARLLRRREADLRAIRPPPGGHRDTRPRARCARRGC